MMSELRDLAHRLAESREKATDGEWAFEDHSIYTNAVGGDYIVGGKHASEEDLLFIVLAANHAVDIIKGYQDLLFRIRMLWDHYNRGNEQSGNALDGLIHQATDPEP